MFNKARQQWQAETLETEGKQKTEDLPLELQEYIYWKGRQIQVKHDIEVLVIQKTWLYRHGYTSENFDFSDLNWQLVELEDDLHRINKRLKGLE